MFSFAIFVVTVAGMELFAYAMHRWVMHGAGWFLHASHHRSRSGMFEWNDLYALIFALPSIGLIFAGVQGSWGPVATSVGAGIAAYGLIYFAFHDAIVHQRLPNRYVPKSAYMKRIVQAHRLHHAAESKHGAVSFGFLYARPIGELKRRLRANSQDLRFRAAAGSTPAGLVE